MYVNLNKLFLDKNTKEGIATAIEQIGEDDGKDQIVFESVINGDTIEDMKINDTDIDVTVSNELGWFSFKIPLDNKVMEDLLNVVIKRMNKIKALIESLK